jgi:hypothetical protein
MQNSTYPHSRYHPYTTASTARSTAGIATTMSASTRVPYQTGPAPGRQDKAVCIDRLLRLPTHTASAGSVLLFADSLLRQVCYSTSVCHQRGVVARVGTYTFVRPKAAGLTNAH